MNKTRYFAVLAVLLICAGMARAQEPKSSGEVLSSSVANAEAEFVSAAEAMPEEKYSFVPTNGEFTKVRNFAQQVKHVAAVNYLLGAGILGEKPPVETGEERGPDSLKSKAEIVKYLRDSYAYAKKAIATINDTNALTSMKSPFGEGTMSKLSMAAITLGHTFDHYGQIVVYLRMNGIIPPASR